MRLKQTQDEINADSAKLAREQKLIVTLEALATTIDTLFVAINAITTHIDTVSSAWATIQTKLKAVVDKLNQAKGREWTEIVSKELDIEQSKVKWTQLREYCERLQEAMLTQSGAVIPVKGAA